MHEHEIEIENAKLHGGLGFKETVLRGRVSGQLHPGKDCRKFHQCASCSSGYLYKLYELGIVY